MLALASLENDLKSRMRPLGTFVAQASLDRLRYGILRGLQTLANLRDWDWLNQTETITTTQGNLGPYTEPTGFIRMALLKQYSQWGYLSKDVLAPILSTDTQTFLPYIQIQDGAVFFLQDPGDSTLTLNYIADIADDITEAGLGATVAMVPNGLKPALVDYAMADVFRDIPSARSEIPFYLQEGRRNAEDYWHQSTLSQVQRGIYPRGVNKAPIDNNAQSMTILTTNYQRYA